MKDLELSGALLVRLVQFFYRILYSAAPGRLRCALCLRARNEDSTVKHRPAPALAGILGLWVLLSGGAALAAEAEPSPPEQGPFTERNQFPFNLLFLAFPARGGAVLAPHAKELLVVTDYANTFAGSDVFTSFTTDERVRLTSTSVDTAQSMEPGEDLFFVDTEQDRTALIYRWGTSRHIEVDVEIPFLSYRGGMFDPAIEWYHRNFGLANGGRDLYVQDIVQMVLTLDHDEYFMDHSPSTFEIGDVSLIGRFPLADAPRGAAALSVGMKFPTGDPESLGGSGSLDAGLELEGTLRWGRQRLHGSAGWVHAGNWSLFPKFHPADLWNLGASYEFAWSPRLSWIGQLQTQSSVFRGSADVSGALADFSTEILVGAKWQGSAGRWCFQTALLENIFDQNNGVDVGMLAGFAVRFSGTGP